MGTCEICGTNTSKIYRASVEGTEMDVCEKCTSYGKVLSLPVQKIKKPVEIEVKTLPEKEESVVADCSSKIRRAREKSGLTQEEFAKKLNEKMSLMRAIENRDMVPDIKLAKKLEKELGIILIEEMSSEKVALKSGGSNEITLGDMIQIKKRKK
jgi:putative transcription factor